MAAHGVVVEDDVVVGQATDPGGGPSQRITTPGGVAQLCDGRLVGAFGAPLQGYRSTFGRSAGGLFDVQPLLAKDSLMQASQGGTGVDAAIVGEHGLPPP